MMQQAALLERIEHLEEDLQDNRTQLLAVRDEFDNVQQENDDLTMEMDRARQTKLQLHATQGDLFSARQNMKILEQKVLYLERLNKEGRQENAMLESAKQPRKRSFAQQLLKSELSRQRLATALKQGDPEVTTKFVHELTEQTREVERLNNLLQKKQKQIDAFQKLRAAENDSRKQADDSLLFAFSKYKLDTDQLKKQVAQTDASKERMQQQIEQLKASRDQFRARSSGKIRVKDCGDNFFRYVSADEFQKKLGRRCLRPIRKQRKPRQPRSKSAEPSPRKQATAASEQVKFVKDMQQEVEVRATPVQKMQALRARIKSGLKDASARAGMEEEFKTWLNKSRADVEGALSRINVSFQPCIKLISSPTA